MALYDVEQNLDNVFQINRKGSAMILNPQELWVTIDGDHGSRNRYVKFSGDSYKLAEIQIDGTYGKNSTERTFMYDLYEELRYNHRKLARDVFYDNMEYDRHLRGWWVNWNRVCKELTDVCIINLMPIVSAKQPPVKPSTQKKKSKYGYGSDTLYASGQLVQSIIVEVM